MLFLAVVGGGEAVDAGLAVEDLGWGAGDWEAGIGGGEEGWGAGEAGLAIENVIGGTLIARINVFALEAIGSTTSALVSFLIVESPWSA